LETRLGRFWRPVKFFCENCAFLPDLSSDIVRLVSYDLAMRRQLRRDWSIAPSLDFSADRRRGPPADDAPASPADAAVAKARESAPGLVDLVTRYQPSYSHHVFSVTTKF
jgi:hypothetical protein